MKNVGKLPDTGGINLKEVSETFAFDKKNIGASLQWILLKDIGAPVIVDGADISPDAINETLAKVLHK